MLHYDQRSHRFVGEHYLVSAEAFFTRVRKLCKAGETIPDGLTRLCDEAGWSLDMPGVEPLFTAADVLNEAQAILARTYRTGHEH